jgi:methylmalonyl-CoA mutase N-terminal domain/subunit
MDFPLSIVHQPALGMGREKKITSPLATRGQSLPGAAKLRAERDSGAFGQAMDRLRIACEGTENTMPFILDAVRAYATLGEIMGVMKEVFGTYEEATEF